MASRVRRLALRLVLCGLAALHATALPPSKAITQYVQDAWSPETSSAPTTVLAMAQTREGYLWIAGSHGLVRFDGVRFVPVQLAGRSDGAANTGLPTAPSGADTAASALLVDRRGALWVGTARLGLFRLEGGRWRRFAREDGLPEGPIRALAEGANGSLWIGTEGTGLSRLRADRASRLTVQDGLSSNTVLSLFGDGRGRLWIGTDHGLDLLEDEERPALVHYTAADGLGAGCVLAIREDRAGTLWIGTKEGAAESLVNPGTLTAFKDGIFSRIEAPVGMSALLEDANGTLWAGTLGSGLRRLQDGILVGSAEQDILSRTSVHALLEDREGSLWIGADPHGLRRLRDAPFRALGREEGLTDEAVECLYQDRRGAVWIGTRGEGVSRLWDGAFTRMGVQDGLPSQRVSAICEDAGGTLWLGTSAGLVRLGGRLTTLAPGPGAARQISALSPEPDGSVWVGTWGGGLFRLAAGRFTPFTRKDGLAGDFVTTLLGARDGTLWIGTTGGISRLASGKLTNATLQESLPSGAEALYEDHEGYLWIGTRTSGLFRYRDGRLVRIGREQGLFDNQVGTIGEDAEGHVWMSSGRGVFRVSRRALQDVAGGRTRTLASFAYGLADGLRTTECDFGQGQLRTRDGRLWFATIRGVAVIDPAAIPINGVAPVAVIEDVAVGDRTLPLGKEVRVPQGRGPLRLRYAGLSLMVPERVRYRYRLDRHDPGWVDAGIRREVTYADLPPGRYTFRVSAANNDGVWSREDASLALVVLPRFWQTIWFGTLVAVALAGLAWASYRRRIGQLEAARATQEWFSRVLIEHQEIERKRIASELHDSLGQSLVIIKNRALLAQASVADPEGTLEQLAGISESAAEALAEVRQIAYDLRPFHLDRLGLAKALESMIATVAEASGVKIASRIDPLDGWLPPAGEIALYRIAQEALGNVVKHAGATEARVVLRAEAPLLHLTIHDNGHGFTPGPPTTAEPGQGGFGLIGMAERAKILGAVLEVRSAPGQGTTIELRARRQQHGS